MPSKLFVGGISWNTDDTGLKRAFEKYGTVREAKVITDRETGRSRGFAFVTFEQDADAASAISGMDGTSLDGREIRVNAAEDKPRTGGGGGGGGGYRGGGNDRGGGRDREWNQPPTESRGGRGGYGGDRGGYGGR